MRKYISDFGKNVTTTNYIITELSPPFPIFLFYLVCCITAIL